jgi:hypothetical protein
VVSTEGEDAGPPTGREVAPPESVMRENPAL